MRKHLIAHRGKYIQRCEDYLAICRGDDCAAQILHLLEYWTECRLVRIEELQSINEVAARMRMPTQSLPDLWLYEKVADFQKALKVVDESDCTSNGGYGDKYVRISLKALEDWGFIESRPSPFPTDRTKEYLFNASAVQDAIDLWWQRSRSKTSETRTVEDSAKVPSSSAKVLNALGDDKPQTRMVEGSAKALSGQNAETRMVEDSVKVPSSSPESSKTPIAESLVVEGSVEAKNAETRMVEDSALLRFLLYISNTLNSSNTLGEPPVPQVPQSPPPTPCACGQDRSIPSTLVQPNQDSLNSLTPPPTAGKDGAAASLDSYRVDRTAESFAQRANIPSYRTSRSENGVKPEFLTYLSATYLPSTPHWREQAKEGNPPSLADAKKWIRDRERGGKGAEVSDRYEAFLEWQDKQVSGQKNTNPHWEAYLAEQEARTEAAKEKWSRIALEQKQATTEQ